MIGDAGEDILERPHSVKHLDAQLHRVAAGWAGIWGALAKSLQLIVMGAATAMLPGVSEAKEIAAGPAGRPARQPEARAPQTPPPAARHPGTAATRSSSGGQCRTGG